MGKYDDFIAAVDAKVKPVAAVGDSSTTDASLVPYADFMAAVDAKVPPPPDPEKPASGIAAIWGDIKNNRSQEFADTWLSKDNLASKVWQTLGHAGGVAGDVVNRALQTASPVLKGGAAVLSGSTPEEVDQALESAGKAIEKVVGSRPVQESIVKPYKQFQEDNPELARNLKAGGEIIGGMTMGKVGGPKVAELAGEIATKAKNAVALPGKARRAAADLVGDMAEEATAVPQDLLRAAGTPEGLRKIRANKGKQYEIGEKLINAVYNPTKSLPEAKEINKMLPHLPPVNPQPIVDELKSHIIENPAPKMQKVNDMLQKDIDWIESTAQSNGGTIPAPQLVNMRGQLDAMIGDQYGKDSEAYIDALKMGRHKIKIGLKDAAARSGNKDYSELMNTLSDKLDILSRIKSHLGSNANIGEGRAESFVNNMFNKGKAYLEPLMKDFDAAFGTNVREDAYNARLAENLNKKGELPIFSRWYNGRSGMTGKIGKFTIGSPRVMSKVLNILGPGTEEMPMPKVRIKFTTPDEPYMPPVPEVPPPSEKEIDPGLLAAQQSADAIIDIMNKRLSEEGIKLTREQIQKAADLVRKESMVSSFKATGRGAVSGFEKAPPDIEGAEAASADRILSEINNLHSGEPSPILNTQDNLGKSNTSQNTTSPQPEKGMPSEQSYQGPEEGQKAQEGQGQGFEGQQVDASVKPNTPTENATTSPGESAGGTAAPTPPAQNQFSPSTEESERFKSIVKTVPGTTYGGYQEGFNEANPGGHLVGIKIPAELSENGKEEPTHIMVPMGATRDDIVALRDKKLEEFRSAANPTNAPSIRETKRVKSIANSIRWTQYEGPYAGTAEGDMGGHTIVVKSPTDPNKSTSIQIPNGANRLEIVTARDAAIKKLDQPEGAKVGPTPKPTEPTAETGTDGSGDRRIPGGTVPGGDNVPDATANVQQQRPEVEKNRGGDKNPTPTFEDLKQSEKSAGDAIEFRKGKYDKAQAQLKLLPLVNSLKKGFSAGDVAHELGTGSRDYVGLAAKAPDIDRQRIDFLTDHGDELQAAGINLDNLQDNSEFLKFILDFPEVKTIRHNAYLSKQSLTEAETAAESLGQQIGQHPDFKPPVPVEEDNLPFSRKPEEKGGEKYPNGTVPPSHGSRLGANLKGESGAVGVDNPLIHSDNFKSWFGDWKSKPEAASKVVDAEGKPLVVYHGTDSDFNVHNRNYLGANTYGYASDKGYAATSKIGFWHNTNPMVRGLENKKSPYPKQQANYVDIKDPLEFDSMADLAAEMDEVVGHRETSQSARRAVNKWVKEQQKKGYDGVMVNDEEFGGVSFVPFNPNQIKSATGNSGTFDPKNPDIRFSRKPDELGFYSPTEKAISELRQEKGVVPQIQAMIKDGKLKKAETDWMDLDGWLKEHPKATKQDALDFVKSNQVELKEVDRKDSFPKELKWRGKDNGHTTKDQKGNVWEIKPENNKYEIYKNGEIAVYTNRAYTLDEAMTVVQELQGEIPKQTKFSKYTLPGAKNYREKLLVAPDWQVSPGRYKSTHWDEPNVVAHTRLSDRTGPNGEKVLFVEEAATAEAIRRLREDVSRTSASNAVPNQPFLKNWHELLMKRILRTAAEEGYDRVAWVNGEQTAEHYNLSKQIGELVHWKSGENEWGVSAVDPKGKEVISQQYYNPKELEATFGKDLAKKISDGTGEAESKFGFDLSNGEKAIRGYGLKIGGEWAVNLYDKMIPQYLDKYGKRWGAKVETVVIKGVGDQQSIAITPAMKESVLGEGQPMFKSKPTTPRTLDIKQAGFESEEHFSTSYKQKALHEHGETEDEFIQRSYCQDTLKGRSNFRLRDAA